MEIAHALRLDCRRELDVPKSACASFYACDTETPNTTVRVTRTQITALVDGHTLVVRYALRLAADGSATLSVRSAETLPGREPVGRDGAGEVETSGL